jgi:hypothetical protein
MLKIHRCLVLMLLTVVALSACKARVKFGHFDEDKIQALAGVEKYRTLYQNQDYARLYDLGSSTFKSSVPKKQFVSAVQSEMAQYGKYKSSVLIASSCFPNEVRLVYDTQYESENVMELMTWSVPGSQAELMNYKVLPSQTEFHKELQEGCPVP